MREAGLRAIVQVRGTLLSVNTVTVVGTTWIRLWVAQGQDRIVAWVPTAEAAFYAVPRTPEATAVVLDLAKARSGSERTRVERKIVGRAPKDVVRVVVRHPGDVDDIARGLKDTEFVDAILEDEIRPEHRFLFESQVSCMAEIEAEGQSDPRVPGLVLTQLRPVVSEIPALKGTKATPGGQGDWTRVEEEGGDGLRTVAIAAEFERKDGPSAGPLLRLALVTASGAELFDVAERAAMPAQGADIPGTDEEQGVALRGSPPQQDPLEEPFGAAGLSTPETDAGEETDEARGASATKDPVRPGEKATIEAFASRIRDLDPDVLVTWGGDTRILGALSARAEASGTRLALARDGAPVEFTGAAANRRAAIAGRAHVDLLRTVERDLRFDVKVKTITNVAEHLGIDISGEDEPMDARTEAESVFRLGGALLPLQAAFARRTHVDLEESSRAGRGRQVEFLLLGEAAKRGILAPFRAGTTGSDEMYEGGLVLDPPTGIHGDVVSLDFGAMYPSLMIAYNISPDTVLAADAQDPPEGVFVAPEVGHRFAKSPDGFFRQILRELVEHRRALKRTIRELKAAGGAAAGATGTPPRGPDVVGQKLAKLDVEQASIKVLTNAMYGYTGWAQARWGSRPCAESTAAWGRGTIRWVVAEAKARGFPVLYADTDGLFVENPEGADLTAFVKDVNAKLPLELEVAEKFRSLLFTGAKKKYAGLTENGQIVARGFEVRRGDWCALARDTQARVLETILRERDAKKGTEVAREAIARLRRGEVSLDDLLIWKTLTARPNAYRVKPMHAAAVERAEAARAGLRVATGAKVAIVMVAGAGPPSARATLREALHAEDKPDLEWYAEKQVLPAALRVLEPLGVDENELAGKPKQRSLGEYF
ncbi:MAG: DNA polymerase domain-containing protein [Thermoplasmatota archaeon]